MKKILSILFLLSVHLMFCQNYSTLLQTGSKAKSTPKEFKAYSIFKTSTQKVKSSLSKIATDIEPIEINFPVLKSIQADQPEFIEFSIVHEGDSLWVKLQQHQVVTEDFSVRNQDNKPLDYTPGLYYRGLVNGDRKSMAVFSFFENSLSGVISEPGNGNRVIAQLKDKSQYVIYSDSKMTVQNDFTCDVDSVMQYESLIPQSGFTNEATSTNNCVKVFYELTNDIYTANNSSVDETLNWLTAVHNVVAVLYSDASITTALSEVLVWQEEDPYTGENLEKLEYFRENRIAFNGDLGHLLDLPITGGVAYLNNLCQSYNHAFSGLSINFQELPTYSWTINVVSHEMGHALGSPHTHACFWNGDNTAIDSCGPNNDYSEGCDDAELPAGGGTIMSYCHLDDVGMNLGLGFHPQVAQQMINTVESKSCLGTDCIDSCMRTVAGLSVEQTDLSAFTLTIEDVISNSWTYSIHKLNNPTNFLETTDNTIVFNENLEPNTYYEIVVANNCTNGNFGGVLSTFFLTDDDWCGDQLFTDSGGSSGNYRSNENMVKTFYPDNTDSKLKFTINDFDLEENGDFMTLYDGESEDAPAFEDGELLSGNSLSRTEFEATNSAGAITVKFTSNGINNRSGWEILTSCGTLSAQEFTNENLSIYPNPFKTNLVIESAIEFDQLIINDMNGRQVYRQKTTSQLETSVDLTQLQAGIYFITLSNSNTKFIKRIIKK